MISVVTDAFFDDICAFYYLMAIRTKMNVFPTGLGYTRPHTTVNVCQGLKHESHLLHVSKLNNKPYNSTYYQKLTDQEALDFGDALAHELHLHGHNDKSQLKYDQNILVLGPYNDLALDLHKHHKHHKYFVFGSFSNLRMSPTDPFPSTITLGKGSNAGIDPIATIKVWSHCHTILPCRQPPIDQVLQVVENVDNRYSRKIAKVLRYSKQHNPWGGYVWDLGMALIYQHPNLITRTQLYDATFNQSTQQIVLTLISIVDEHKTQITLVDVDIDAMMIYLHNDLTS
jgi:hypothetical protein